LESLSGDKGGPYRLVAVVAVAVAVIAAFVDVDGLGIKASRDNSRIRRL